MNKMFMDNLDGQAAGNDFTFNPVAATAGPKSSDPFGMGGLFSKQELFN